MQAKILAIVELDGNSSEVTRSIVEPSFEEFEAIVSTLGLGTIGDGTYQCPFCETQKGFWANVRQHFGQPRNLRWTWVDGDMTCSECGFSGDLLDVVRRVQGSSLADAAEWVAHSELHPCAPITFSLRFEARQEPHQIPLACSVIRWTCPEPFHETWGIIIPLLLELPTALDPEDTDLVAPPFGSFSDGTGEFDELNEHLASSPPDDAPQEEIVAWIRSFKAPSDSPEKDRKLTPFPSTVQQYVRGVERFKPVLVNQLGLDEEQLHDGLETMWLFNDHLVQVTGVFPSRETVEALVVETVGRHKSKASSIGGSQTSPGRRKGIPSNVRTFVWRRDGGKCVDCGNNENIEYDHIIPVSKGGANTARNLQLLCESCNRRKSDHI